MALLPQRPIRENIAVPLFNRLAAGGRSTRPGAGQVSEAVTRLSIDTRAAAQARQLSGGNQQKLTIGRWLAAGFRTLLLFDPTGASTSAPSTRSTTWSGSWPTAARPS